MIKFHECKVGDIVLAEFEGQRFEGEIIALDAEEKKVCVETSVQEFWYSPEHLFPIVLDEDQLMQFGFERVEYENGQVKYMHGPFRILLSSKGDFSHFEMWYREDRRHITSPIMVHELQNHFRGMTKVELVREVKPVR